MFKATEVVIDAFVDRLEVAYRRNYGSLERNYCEILQWAGRMALERIAQTDAFYHTVDHTIMVTLVGQEILRGKHMSEGGVSPRDWLQFVISLLCHDIGYVRGVCRADNGRICTRGVGDETIRLPLGATDASLTAHHVDRGKLFVHERFGGHELIDADAIARNIELTRFPVPDEQDRKETNDYPGLVRAADLIGQLADPDHLRKLPALFQEFEETGTNARLGYKSWDDLRSDYPSFFWNQVHPFLGAALRHLEITQEGRQWTANLFSQVFAAERRRSDSTE
ncbi:MAG: metal-dependent phosphohydrolase [Myxococcota bacterium]|nr:metal-dependent phosphohydrolase [Myxococcota bacterium]